MSGFHLFAYGTLRRGGGAEARLDGCDWIAEGTVGGVLYDIDGRFPALLLYGTAPVRGDVWRCPTELLPDLDRYEGTAAGLFRRVGIEVATPMRPVPCWAYAAGPALSGRLLPERRIDGGEWRPDPHTRARA